MADVVTDGVLVGSAPLCFNITSGHLSWYLISFLEIQIAFTHDLRSRQRRWSDPHKSVIKVPGPDSQGEQIIHKLTNFRFTRFV